MIDDKKESTSGKVQVTDGKIVWSYQNETVVEIHLNEISVIGEYTNSDGPYFDDWFMVFVTKDGQWKHISWYAENIDDLATVLSEKFQFDFHGSFLTGSTEWASVVIYPLHLKNEPLFTLTLSEQFKEPKTFFQRLQYGIGVGGFDTTKYFHLSDAVKRELTHENR
jgi:hypothetical protein